MNLLFVSSFWFCWSHRPISFAYLFGISSLFYRSVFDLNVLIFPVENGPWFSRFVPGQYIVFLPLTCSPWLCQSVLDRHNLILLLECSSEILQLVLDLFWISHLYFFIFFCYFDPCFCLSLLDLILILPLAYSPCFVSLFSFYEILLSHWYIYTTRFVSINVDIFWVDNI